MRGQRRARWRKRFNFYFNGLSFVAELTKSIASNWLLTCLCLKQVMVVYFAAKHIFVKTRIKSTLFWIQSPFGSSYFINILAAWICLRITDHMKLLKYSCRMFLPLLSLLIWTGYFTWRIEVGRPLLSLGLDSQVIRGVEPRLEKDLPSGKSWNFREYPKWNGTLPEYFLFNLLNSFEGFLRIFFLSTFTSLYFNNSGFALDVKFSFGRKISLSFISSMKILGLIGWLYSDFDFPPNLMKFTLLEPRLLLLSLSLKLEILRPL